MARGAAGSAHHQPNAALRARPANSAADSQANRKVSWASARRVGDAERLGGAAFGRGEGRHDGEGERREHDPDGGLAGFVVDEEQIAGGFDEHAGGEH